MKYRLGLDVAGVIIDGHNDPHYARHLDEASYLGLRPIPGVFDAVRTLAQKRFGENVWLISRCSPRIAGFAATWMRKHGFFQKTGVPEGNFISCGERADKANHCRALGISHFVDNRLEVLSHMVGIVPHLYLFRGIDADLPKFTDSRARVSEFAEWPPVVKALLFCDDTA